MAEQLHNITLSAAELAAVAEIGQDALRTVEINYGTGFPHFLNGVEANLAFHGGYHTKAVPRDAVRVGEALGLSVPELVTAESAGFAHDLVQLKPRGVMEADSAAWYEEEIRRKGLPAVLAEAGSLAIKGTEPIFDGNKLVGQQATQQDYPSKSAERVALSVACGDFGELFTPRSSLFGHLLFKEIRGVDPRGEPSMEGLLEYEKGQLALRTEYQYPLTEANQVLATHRPEVIAHTEETVRLLERGDLESWRALELRDLEFMQQHS